MTRTTQVTTNALRAGDTLEFGNEWTMGGITNAVVVSVEPSQYSNTKIAVTYLYDNGSTWTDYVGKNARWYVLNKVAA